jgi:hypothetical protein
LSFCDRHGSWRQEGQRWYVCEGCAPALTCGCEFEK